MEVKDYAKYEEKFFRLLRSKLKNRLLLYCVTGGLSRGEVIPGWSDIDVLLVFDKLDRSALTALKNSLDECASPVKIGTTFYGLEDFNAELYKDPKTYQSINYINQVFYKPRIWSKKVRISPASTTVAFDNVDVSRALHDIKRQLVQGDKEYQEEKVGKLVFTILKIYLRNMGVRVEGYSEILKTSQKYLNFAIKLPLPGEIITNSKGKSCRYVRYVDFLNWVCQNPYWQPDQESLLRVKASKATRRVRAVIVDNGRVLTIRRYRPDKDKNFWVFPGGAVRSHESDIDALKRTVEEELGVVVEPESWMSTLPFQSPSVETPDEEVFYRCSILSRPKKINYRIEPANGTYEPEWLKVSDVTKDTLLEPFPIRDLLIGE